MALIYIYSPLAQGQTITQNQKKAARDGNNISFSEKLCGIGEFSLEIPSQSSLCDYLKEDDIIGIDGNHFGIIREIIQRNTESGSVITVSGEDLKGYLSQRLTLYPTEAIQEGLQGYDAINNVSTETLVKYFLKNNITEPTNEKRIIPSFVIAPDLNRGKQNDQYMSRFEYLNELLQKNLEPQKLGYSITPNLAQSQFIFDVVQGTDRTAFQNENPRVIFDISYKNLLSLEYTLSIRSYKNIFYSSLSKSKNEAETLTCMYMRDNEDESSGAVRREMHMNVSVNLAPEQIYDNMRKYALKNAADYEVIENLTAVATNKFSYKKDYFLGDFVTLQARSGIFKNKRASIDVQITGIKETWQQDNKIMVELEFGKGRLTRYDTLKRKINNE